MATITVFAQNLFEIIGLIQPRIEVMVREAPENGAGSAPLRMQWVRGTDSDGRRILRVEWVEDKKRARAES
ncbi:MAG: hypothetical protein CXZ00_01635 [Acidobacteria bacterium]|nr:MAG: hypothetical protein CXZ00_01635 [Acidobacteriota bacterium]